MVASYCRYCGSSIDACYGQCEGAKSMKPYLPERRLTEDPIDGTHPPKHRNRNVNRAHKKGARQEGKAECREEEKCPASEDGDLHHEWIYRDDNDSEDWFECNKCGEQRDKGVVF